MCIRDSAQLFRQFFQRIRLDDGAAVVDAGHAVFIEEIFFLNCHERLVKRFVVNAEAFRVGLLQDILGNPTVGAGFAVFVSEALAFLVDENDAVVFNRQLHLDGERSDRAGQLDQIHVAKFCAQLFRHHDAVAHISLAWR